MQWKGPIGVKRMIFLWTRVISKIWIYTHDDNKIEPIFLMSQHIHTDAFNLDRKFHKHLKFELHNLKEHAKKKKSTASDIKSFINNFWSLI